MKRMDFVIEKQNNMDVIKYVLGAADVYDDKAADKASQIPNVIPFQYQDVDGKRIYNAYAHEDTTLDVFLKKALTKPEVYGILGSLASVFEIGAKGIPVSYIVKDTSYIYVNKETLTVKVLLLPLKQDNMPLSEIPAFFREIVSGMRFDEADTDNYVAKILTQINADDFSANNLKAFIDAEMEKIGMFIHKENGPMSMSVGGAQAPAKDVKVNKIGVMNNMRPQGMPPQGMALQQMAPQGMRPQGMVLQQMPPQGMALQQMPPQGMRPQGMPPQGMAPQGMPPQGMPKPAPQGMAPQGMAPQGMPPQGMPKPAPQGMPPQGMAPQGMPPQGMAPQGMPPQGMPKPAPQGMAPQGMAPQGMPPQGMPKPAPQGMPPQGMAPQGMAKPAPQGMPPQGTAPQGMPPQGMPKPAPQGMPPQGTAPQGMPPQGMPKPAPQGMPPQGMEPQGMPPQGMPKPAPQGMPPQGMAPQGMPPQEASKPVMQETTQPQDAPPQTADTPETPAEENTIAIPQAVPVPENAEPTPQEAAPVRESEKTIGNLVGQLGTKPIPHLVRKKTGEIINITKPEFKIGKAVDRVDYAITDNVAISRVHCVIVQKDGVNYIKDNGSTNHTYLDGAELVPSQEKLLKHKTTVLLGDEEFTFLLRKGD